MLQGKIIIISAPSGAGKTTIVRHLLATNECLTFSISATTRKKRPYEEHGHDYYFLDLEDFKQKIKQDAFIEYEEVYTNLFYGTLKEEIERIWELGKHVIVDVDVKGGLNLKNLYRDKALAIFVKPPNIATLEKRLRNRKTDSEEKLKERVQKAVKELTYEPKFDNTIVNDKLEDALIESEKLVNQFIS